MTITLYTEGFINASHSLPHYKGACAQSHGHTWKIAVWIRGEEAQLDAVGILWDYNNLYTLITEYDHHNLNECMTEAPTAESMTLQVYSKFKTQSPHLSFRIRVYESVVPTESYAEVGDF